MRLPLLLTTLLSVPYVAMSLADPLADTAPQVIDLDWVNEPFKIADKVYGEGSNIFTRGEDKMDQFSDAHRSLETDKFGYRRLLNIHPGLKRDRLYCFENSTLRKIRGDSQGSWTEEQSLVVVMFDRYCQVYGSVYTLGRRIEWDPRDDAKLTYIDEIDKRWTDEKIRKFGQLVLLLVK